MMVQLSLDKFVEYLEKNQMLLKNTYTLQGVPYLLLVHVENSVEHPDFAVQSVLLQHPRFFIVVDQGYELSPGTHATTPLVIAAEPSGAEYYLQHLTQLGDSRCDACVLSTGRLVYEDTTYELTTTDHDQERYGDPAVTWEDRLQTIINKHSVKSFDDGDSVSLFSQVDEPTQLSFEDGLGHNVLPNTVLSELHQPVRPREHNAFNTQKILADYELMHDYGQPYVVVKLSSFFDLTVDRETEPTLNLPAFVTDVLSRYVQLLREDRQQRQLLCDYITSASSELHDKYVRMLQLITSKEEALDVEERRLVAVTTKLQAFVQKTGMSDDDAESASLFAEARRSLDTIREERMRFREYFLKFFETRKTWYGHALGEMEELLKRLE